MQAIQEQLRHGTERYLMAGLASAIVTQWLAKVGV